MTTHDVSRYGAVGDICKDDTAAIQRAIAALRTGDTLYFPHGNYRLHSMSIFSRNGVTITGDDATLVGSAEDTPVVQVVRSSRVILDRLHIRHTGAAGARNTTGHGIRLADCTDVQITGNQIELVCGAGIFLERVNRCTIRDNNVHSTLADGCHCTCRSSNVSVLNNRFVGTGDDAIAFVSYRKDGGQVTRCAATGNTIQSSSARGVAVIGGVGITVAANMIEGTVGAGVMVAQENSFDTYGPSRVRVAGNTIMGAGISPTVDHAAITISCDDASRPAEAIHVSDNTIFRSGRRDIFSVPSAPGGVDRLVIDGNACFGSQLKSGYASIETYQTESVVIRGNTLDRCQYHGIVVDSATSFAHVTGNTVSYPNQQDAEGTFAIFNGAREGVTSDDNAVRPDPLKTALRHAIWTLPRLGENVWSAARHRPDDPIACPPDGGYHREARAHTRTDQPHSCPPEECIPGNGEGGDR